MPGAWNGRSGLGAADIGLAVLIVAAITLGGSGSPSPFPEMLLELWALAIAALVAWLDRDPIPWPQPALAFAGALLALPVLQLIPLPPELWRSLPGREAEAAALALIRAEHRWMPLTISPARTLAALLAMIVPAIAVVLAARASTQGRRWALSTMIAMALLSVVLGAAQLADGPYSALRFYAHSHVDDLTGFQANRNAQADILLVGLIGLGALVTAWPPSDRRKRLMLTAAAALVLVAGILLTASRTGIGILAALLVALGVWRARLRSSAAARLLHIAAGTVALAGLAALAAGMTGNLSLNRVAARFAGGDEARPELWLDTLHAIGQYWPAGSGLGTFVPAFLPAERLEFVDPSVPNRAHNDFLELALEAGLPGLLLLTVLGGILAVQAVRRLRDAEATREARAQTLFAACTLGVLAAHSLVDYPLRSMALATVAGAASGMILWPAGRRRATTSPTLGEDERT